ncbi:hypothetical protein EYZ11_008593 [Aspergillus tanneri]|uniref:F-box domain-containing protein n=1 Tax=Aspergillus tanneri TaxID=1220188 RepID=A0A4S3JC93_9EURO|nr:uncharacterized protein ATNIH1004_005484 [Aspergillus tanneri]KAA8646809.1 hypothetical protein ATNIH1004_005484 [Aspergillus tanneri]THC91938.1 hypothetical protein EYZ11_008593 [Aspergillus tanneri]
MASFLQLPHELQEIILEYALITPASPPVDPWTGKENRQPLHDVDYKAWSFGPNNTLYDTSQQDDLAGTSSALLRTSWQIHEETKGILDRMARPCYLLDVMIVHGLELWPTWLSVPVLRTHLDEVRVTFRIFGHCISREGMRSTLGDGGHNGPEWCFYALLERFLVHGPVTSRQPGKHQEKKVYVKTLTINFESAADEEHPLPPPELTWKDYFRYKMRVKDGPDLSHYAMRPEWLANSLRGQIASLLALSSYTTRYGVFLYEHIGSIRVLVEGEFVEEFDLAKQLAPMKYDCDIANFSRDPSREYFWRWKRRAQRVRQEAGLPVIWADDPEFAEYPED